MSIWQDISTAPKDGTRILLYRPSAREWAWVVVGEFCNDEYSRRPRPFWDNDRSHLEGKVAARTHQPTHWMPLPDAPEAE